MMRMLSPWSPLLTVIRHDEHAAGRRSAQSQGSRLLLGVTQIRAIEGIRIGEHGRRLLERDPGCRRPSARPTRTWFSIYEIRWRRHPVLDPVNRTSDGR